MRRHERCAHSRGFLAEKKRHELTESVSALKDGGKEHLVAKESPDTDEVALSVERDSLLKSLPAREAELEELQVIVDATSDCAEVLENLFEQQKNSFVKTRAALRTQLAEAEVQLGAALNEMMAYKYDLRDAVGRLSSSWSVLNVMLKTNRRRLSTIRTEFKTISGQLTELWKRLKEVPEQEKEDVKYELDEANSRITQLGAVKDMCRKFSTAF